jgi:hypothetical protein
MAQFKYLFRRSALLQAGAIIFNVVVGVVGLSAGMASLAFYLLLLIGLAWAVVAWNEGARQAQANDEDSKLLRAIAQQNERTFARSGVEDLKRLSNDDLRERVRQCAARMRTFDDGVTAGRRLSVAGRSVENTQKATSEFRQHLLPEALAIREELRRRTGMFEDDRDEHRAVALDFGMLAGPHPAADAADYLEGLARKLP